VEDGFAEKVTCFRRILQIRAIDNNAVAEIYTDHEMSVIRDLTLCLQATENRFVFIALLCTGNCIVGMWPGYDQLPHRTTSVHIGPPWYILRQLGTCHRDIESQLRP